MDIGKLDDSYNKLTEVMAEGERDDYAGGCLGSKPNHQSILLRATNVYSIYRWETLFENLYDIFWVRPWTKVEGKIGKGDEGKHLSVQTSKILLQQVDLPKKITQTFHNHYIYAEWSLKKYIWPDKQILSLVDPRLFWVRPILRETPMQVRQSCAERSEDPAVAPTFFLSCSDTVGA